MKRNSKLKDIIKCRKELELLRKMAKEKKFDKVIQKIKEIIGIEQKMRKK